VGQISTGTSRKSVLRDRTECLAERRRDLAP
jgi:hypothetical protein